MSYLDDGLPYFAALITMAAGIFGFFWAKSGERHAVGGVGWSALAFVVAAGLVTIIGTYRASQTTSMANRNAAAARAAAAALDEELRQSLLRQSFVMITLIAGIDFRQAVPQGTFYFEEVYGADGSPIEPAGFVGPFPALGRDGWGLMRLNIDERMSFVYFLTPAAGGATALISDSRRRPHYSISPTDGLDQIERLGAAPATPSDAEWSGFEPVGGGADFRFASNVQFRRLISILAHQKSYGRLIFSLPGASGADLNRVIQGYRFLRPVLVFPASRPGDMAGPDEPCHIFLRVPMDVVHIRTHGQTLLFELRASSRRLGVPEVCQPVQDQS